MRTVITEQRNTFREVFSLRQEPLTSMEGQRSHKTILVLEDDAAVGEMIALALAQEAMYTPLVVADPQAALAILRSHPVHLLLLDYHVAASTGLEVYDHLQAQEAWRTLPVLIMSDSLERHEQELRARNLAGLSKPFDLDDLFQTIEQVLTVSREENTSDESLV